MKDTTKGAISLIIMLLIMFTMIGIVNAQEIPKKVKVTDKSVKDTVIKDVSYKLYVGAKGGKYIIRTSKKTGNEYKQYIKKNIKKGL